MIGTFLINCILGSEQEAISAVQCPDPILGYFDFIYIDQTGTFCDTVNTSTILACSNQSYAELLVDNTGCTAQPFYSSMYYFISFEQLRNVIPYNLISFKKLSSY